ncbi:MAG: signal peptidase I [Thermoproteota archaeon]
MNKRKIIRITPIIGLATSIAILLLFYRPISLLGDTRYEPVYTSSMKPVIPVGSLVVIKPVDPETLKTGDIICFKISESTSVTHRVVNITQEGYITKGDANEDPDQWRVKKEDLIGKVICSIPYLGHLIYFVRSPIGFILLIIIPTATLIVLEVRDIIKELKKT